MRTEEERQAKEKAIHDRFVERFEAKLKKLEESAQNGRLRDATTAHQRLTEDAAGIARITDTAYNRAGRVATLTAYTDGTSGAQDTVYQYNGRDQETVVTYEETGDVSMKYDAVGNMTQRLDARPVTVDYAYDLVGRLTDQSRDREGAGRCLPRRTVFSEVAALLLAVPAPLRSRL